MKVVGVCRFSLVGRGDWKAFQGKTDAEADAIVAERAQQLFTAERMEARLSTFEQLTLASMAAQTDQDFRFIVLASELMPQTYRDRLRQICDAVPQVVLRFFPAMAAHVAQKAVFRELRLQYSDTLQFRLDDDDCLCVDFVALMKAHAAPRMSDSIFVASVRDVLYSSIGGQQAGVYDWPVEFMSAGAAIRHPSKSIYEFGHFGMAKRFPAIVIPGRMSLVTHNGLNDTQFTPALIKRRGMTPMPPEQIRAAVALNFPFLTPQARVLAGLAPSEAVPDPAPQAPEEPAPPRWLNDMLSTRHRKGFFVADDLFALQHTHRSGQVLYVSFDNLASVRAQSKARDPWGYGFAAKSEWSSLGVLCYRPNWFRIPKLHQEFSRLAESGFFRQYRRVVFSGTSMGAYAACAFSSLVPGSTVIAFSPQSTLMPGVADWDQRYPSGTAADWSGPLADAAQELSPAGKAWILYDPRVEADRRHAERLRGDNVTLLRARHSGHFTAQYLRQIGMLSTFVRECVNDEMSETRFYQLYRVGRDYRRYLDGLVKQALAHPNFAVRRRLAAVLRHNNRPGLANDLEKPLAAE